MNPRLLITRPGGRVQAIDTENADMTAPRDGIDHRCGSCRFWSEMIAQACGGPVEALCLNLKSPFKTRYRTAVQRCTEWRHGRYGAVDDPESGEIASERYRLEDQGAPQP